MKNGVHKINLSQNLSRITEFWRPKVVGELNGQEIKLVKCRGEFIWHHHEREDEFFLCLHGSFRVELRDQTIQLTAGEAVVIPHGVEHRTVADEEASILIFEPAATRNTGNVEHPTLTAPISERL